MISSESTLKTFLDLDSSLTIIEPDEEIVIEPDETPAKDSPKKDSSKNDSSEKDSSMEIVEPDPPVPEPVVPEETPENKTEYVPESKSEYVPEKKDVEKIEVEKKEYVPETKLAVPKDEFVPEKEEFILGSPQSSPIKSEDSPDVKLLMRTIEKQNQELRQLREKNKEWLHDFDQRVEDYRKNQYYRPHSTYDKLIKT